MYIFTQSNIFKYLVYIIFQGRNLSNISLVFWAMQQLHIFILRFHDLYKFYQENCFSLILPLPFLLCTKIRTNDLVEMSFFSATPMRLRLFFFKCNIPEKQKKIMLLQSIMKIRYKNKNS